ncbi:marine proteobacterial sortase target protein [Pseudomarimonas salicorniae]|uniref:Marine proteobacterial sortase target protein n=1 Tax=Pseudomarimonas salicorniae TaxID=2933270 RepID=A0ABT0GHL5_9GAMM|nr:marine proteobacterial sortase target protein [Lysobacter sp. CAU 1642]MCK7593923.1 marine proteobacterial sortase target protein [Lysobacter sp. CAU 1642]
MQPADRVTRKPRLYARPGRRRLPRWLILLGLSLALPVQAAEFGLEFRAADGEWQPGLAMDTDIAMTVVGLLAEVRVTQSYQNDTPHWQEGRYLLPLPAEAAVGSLRIRVGQRLIEGEVQEKQQAQRTYQAATANGQRAALVEQDRPNLFRTAVSNIAPGERVEIEIGYWQQVDFRDGLFSLSLPLTLTPRYRAGGSPVDAPTGDAPRPAAAAKLSQRALEPTVALSAWLHAGLPLAEVASPTHDIDVRRDGDAHLIRLANFVEASDRDFALTWRPAPSASPQRALFTEEVDGETFALLMVVPPNQPVAPVPRELILVIDHSGSMSGTSMQQAIAALDSALAKLRVEDRFNVVRFDHTTEALFAESVPALPGNVRQARQWVQQLSADGGTEMAPALSLAFSSPPVPGHLRQVVLATDAAIGNENQLLAQIEAERGEARLFPVGIGSAPNQHFIRRAAESGRGSFALIRSVSEVEAGMGLLLAKIDRPLMQDISVDWPVAAEGYPHALPDLYSGEPLQLVARIDGLAGALKLQGQTRHAQWKETLPLALGKQSRQAGIARLWASAKLRDLQNALRGGADAAAIRKASLEVALRHGLASEYTSLVAVERKPVRPAAADLASTAIANAAPAGSLALAQGSTPARQQLGWALALLLIGMALFGTRRDAATSTQGRGAGRPPARA